MRNEDTITTYIADILRERRNTWTVESQETLLREAKRPDITVTETSREPVVIEVKVDYAHSPNLDGEEQAKGRLNKWLASYKQVKTAIALRVPHRFRQLSSAETPDALRDANDLHYALFSVDAPHRFPNSGWIIGNISDVATALRIGAIPISKIAQAAEDLESGVNEAAILLAAAIETRPHIAEIVEKILYQEAGKQTYRMAMLIITNAFVFQSALAGTPEMETVPSLVQLQTVEEQLNVNEVLNAWEVVRQVNYRPIFDVAYRLTQEVLATDDGLVGQVLERLRSTAQGLIAQGLAQIHELAGIVFQRLIVDRRFIKANYTRPESVALLSALVLPNRQSTLGEGLSTFPKIADFACGTGALLNGLYQRILALHEQAGGSGKDIHQQMVENKLVGADIMPNASHLTASIIASTYPNVKIGKTRIHTMAYGTQRPDGKYAIGALDLLENPEATLSLGLINTERVQGDDGQDDTQRPEFRHGEFDIVVDNPPFTRIGADNNSDNPDVPTTVFGDRDKKVAEAMKASLRSIETSIANSNAGLGSYFVDLADRMLKNSDGDAALYPPTMGFVLPLTVLTSPNWQKVRELWATMYHGVTVVTIADAKTEDCAFSADTAMAECLVVAVKGRGENTGRGTFVCLHRRPNSHLDAVEIAKRIQRLQDVRRFEDPPISGNPIKIGDEIVGSALNCPLQGVWVTTRIKELSLIQSAYHLANGRVWLPGQRDPLEVPMSSVGEIATIGFNHRTIKDPSWGAFDIEMGCSDTDLYPGLWHLDSDNQRAMVVQPDCHGIIRSNYWDKAQQILERNGRVHHNLDLRFNANSLSVLFTEKTSIGIGLPNVVFNNPLHDYVFSLWGNSTLGLLCYWMHCNKQHEGRGRVSLKVLESIPTLDVRQLDQAALQNAECIFEEMKHKRMLPFNQMFEDMVRQELDERFLSEVLGICESTHPDVHAGLHRLREQLCAEPSIHGGKQSRVVL